MRSKDISQKYLLLWILLTVQVQETDTLSLASSFNSTCKQDAVYLHAFKNGMSKWFLKCDSNVTVNYVKPFKYLNIRLEVASWGLGWRAALLMWGPGWSACLHPRLTGRHRLNLGADCLSGGYWTWEYKVCVRHPFLCVSKEGVCLPVCLCVRVRLPPLSQAPSGVGAYFPLTHSLPVTVAPICWCIGTSRYLGLDAQFCTGLFLVAAWWDLGPLDLSALGGGWGVLGSRAWSAPV